MNECRSGRIWGASSNDLKSAGGSWSALIVCVGGCAGTGGWGAPCAPIEGVTEEDCWDAAKEVESASDVREGVEALYEV